MPFSPPVVAVVGATGLLGAPVARRLHAEGHRVRALVRDVESARRRLGNEIEYLRGSVSDDEAVDRLLGGADAVHISLAARDSGELDAIEHRGTARVARAAQRHGLRRITYLSGSLVHENYGEKIPEHRAKLAAERAIEATGIPYTFFRPTYVTDNLPRHVQGPVALLFGRQRRVLHPIAADDLAASVARALVLPEAANRDFFLHGPEPITLAEALRLYVALVEPRARVVSVPVPLMSAIDRLFLGGTLGPAIAITRLLQALGERGDPEAARAVLGAPQVSVRAWCEAQAGVSS